MTVDNERSIPLNITFATEQKLSTLEFSTYDIVKIIKSLDPNKAHGHDEISMSKNLCQFSLETVFKSNVSLKNGRKPTLYLFIKKMINN